MMEGFSYKGEGGMHTRTHIETLKLELAWLQTNGFGLLVIKCYLKQLPYKANHSRGNFRGWMQNSNFAGKHSQ